MNSTNHQNSRGYLTKEAYLRGWYTYIKCRESSVPPLLGPPDSGQAFLRTNDYFYDWCDPYTGIPIGPYAMTLGYCPHK